MTEKSPVPSPLFTWVYVDIIYACACWDQTDFWTEAESNKCQMSHSFDLLGPAYFCIRLPPLRLVSISTLQSARQLLHLRLGQSLLSPLPKRIICISRQSPRRRGFVKWFNFGVDWKCIPKRGRHPSLGPSIHNPTHLRNCFLVKNCSLSPFSIYLGVLGLGASKWVLSVCSSGVRSPESGVKRMQSPHPSLAPLMSHILHMLFLPTFSAFRLCVFHFTVSEMEGAQGYFISHELHGIGPFLSREMSRPKYVVLINQTSRNGS